MAPRKETLVIRILCKGLATVPHSSESSAPGLFSDLASNSGCISKTMTLNLQSKNPWEFMALFWKREVCKMNLKKQKVDMLPSTASLQKDLSSACWEGWKLLLFIIWSDNLQKSYGCWRMFKGNIRLSWLAGWAWKNKKVLLLMKIARKDRQNSRVTLERSVGAGL